MLLFCVFVKWTHFLLIMEHSLIPRNSSLLIFNFLKCQSFGRWYDRGHLSAARERNFIWEILGLLRSLAFPVYFSLETISHASIPLIQGIWDFCFFILGNCFIKALVRWTILDRSSHRLLHISKTRSRRIHNPSQIRINPWHTRPQLFALT